MYLSLERMIGKPDSATVRARQFALMMAKRAAAPLTDANADELPHFAPELWLQIARAVPLSCVHAKWVECPFLEWATMPTSAFPTAYAEFSRRLVVGLRECMAEYEAECEAYEAEFPDARPYDDYYELEALRDDAWCDAKKSCGCGHPVFDGLELDGSRGYHFAFFSPRSAYYHARDLDNNQRSIPGCVKALQCMQRGRPDDMAVKLRALIDEHDYDPDDEDSVEGFCTLDALFAVDWEVSCASTARSGGVDDDDDDNGEIVDSPPVRLPWNGEMVEAPPSRRRLLNEGTSAGRHAHSQLMEFMDCIVRAGVSLAEFRMIVRIR